MGTRLDDMLALVSRVQEKRPDVRLMLRQDPDVDREVHQYLDDLLWLSRRSPLQPALAPMSAGRAQLLASLAGQSRRRRALGARLRLLAAATTTSLLFATALSTQAATHRLPPPVDEVLSGFFSARASEPGLRPLVTGDSKAHHSAPGESPAAAESMGEPGTAPVSQ